MTRFNNIILMRNFQHPADLNRTESISIFLSNHPATTQAMEVIISWSKALKVVNGKEVQIWGNVVMWTGRRFRRRAFLKETSFANFAGKIRIRLNTWPAFFPPENTFLTHHAVVNSEKVELTYEEICSFSSF